MDANPWTYEVMGQEMDRWYTDLSTNPTSPQPGDARQYAYVQLATTGAGVSSVAVDLQLAGSATWYQSDLGSGYPLVGTGVLRTVVKMPTDWSSRAITGVRLRVFPASAAPSVSVSQVIVHGLDANWTLSTRSIPAPTVVGATPRVPVALRIIADAPASRTTTASAAVAPLRATVTDSLGERLAGVPVVFAVDLRPGGHLHQLWLCVGDGGDRIRRHGQLGTGHGGAGPGTTRLRASVADPLAAPATFSVRVRAGAAHLV